MRTFLEPGEETWRAVEAFTRNGERSREAEWEVWQLRLTAAPSLVCGNDSVKARALH